MKTKTPQPDKLRMSADEFDNMMRRALQAPPPPKKPTKPTTKKRTKPKH